MSNREGHKIGVQAWVAGSGESVPSALLVQRPSNDPDSPAKPAGGMWTSSWHDRRGSAWTRWCISHDFGARPMDVWLLTPHPRARIFDVASRKHLVRLQRRYPLEGGRKRDNAIDWDAVSADYDAVHLTFAAEKLTSEPGQGLEGWRCESTVWLRWGFLRVVHYGEYHGGVPVGRARRREQDW